jgi:hypothetical protein
VPLLQGTVGPDDPPMSVVVERYQPASAKYPHGRFTCFVPNKKVLYDGDNPYEEIPLVDFHWTPVTTTFWTKDYVTDLIAPQRFLNKRMSQLGEFSNSSAYSPWLLAPGVKSSDMPTDFPVRSKTAWRHRARRATRAGGWRAMPPTFMQSIDLVVKLLNDMAGGSDLFEESRFPGQLRGPQAVPLLQELLDTEWGPLYNHIGERLARVKQMRLNRVKQYYPALRTMHYVDKTSATKCWSFRPIRSSARGRTITSRSIAARSCRSSARCAKRGCGNGSPPAGDSLHRRTHRPVGQDEDRGRSAVWGHGAGRARSPGSQARDGTDCAPVERRADPAGPPVLQPSRDARRTRIRDENDRVPVREPADSATPSWQRWQEHQADSPAAGRSQQQGMQDQMVQTAVAQATQQAAAQAAAETVKTVMAQMQAQQINKPSTWNRSC